MVLSVKRRVNVVGHCVALISGLLMVPPTASAQESLNFVLHIDGCEGLGTFSKVTGLDVTWDLAEYRSGGSADVHRFFYPIDTPPKGVLTLSRTAEAEDDALTRCLSDVIASGEPVTGSITQLDPAGEPIVRWTFVGGYPSKWTGFSPEEGNSVGMETLVLAHEGFRLIECTRCVP